MVELVNPNGHPPQPTDHDHNDQVQDDYVDPANIDVIQTIDGATVPNRTCFLKPFSFTIFNDTFPYKLNPKLYPVLITELSYLLNVS